MKTSFDKYQLLERIGVGGMAEVFLAKSQGVEGFEKQLVIKKILPELSSNKRFVEMFIAEARIATALNHPNIAQIYDFGKVEDEFFIAMEFVDGWDLGYLSRLSAEVERLPVGDAIWIGLEIARGLDYAHRRQDDMGQSLGLVHRDISPQNILVSRDGAIKIVDFGIAMASLVDEESPNVVKGKFCYMSPEQANGERLDHRSDLFSLGVVLFELICGRPLFKQSSKEQTLSLVKSAVVPDLKDLNDAIPEAFELVLYKLLEREPDARYQTARELQQDLMRLLYGLGSLHDGYSISEYIQRTANHLEQSEQKDPRESGQTRTVRTNVVHKGGKTRGSEATTAQLGLHQASVGFTPVTPAFSDGITDPGEDGQRPLEILARTRKEVVLIAGVLEGLFALRNDVGQERWLHVFQEYTRMVDSIAFKSNGVVHRVNETGFIILLGVPISSENDAERGARVALDMRDAMNGINLSLNHPLKLAMGVAISDVVLEQGPLRHGQRRYSWAFVGDSHEFADQLARAGMGDEILLGSQIWRRIRRQYHCVALDGLKLDLGGELTRTQAWRLGHLKSWKERLKEVQHAYHMFHGREVELRSLRGSYRQVLMDGLAQGAVLTGEQGVGKSTLVEEFLRGLDPRDVRVVRGVANVLEQGTPLGGVSTLLAELMRLGSRDDVRALRGTLETRMEALFPDESEEEREMLLHSMGAIFGLRYEGSLFEELTGEERRKRTSLTLRKFLRRFAERKPVVVMIDDAHHLDAMTLELVTQIFSSRFEAPLFLVLVMTRAGMGEFEMARWDRLQAAKYMKLEEISELSDDDARKLCVELLRSQRIEDEALVDSIVQKAGGNPFYIKEVVEIMRDRGVLQDSGERRQVRLELVEQGNWLPTSVEGAIAARIERLALEQRTLLQKVALFWSPFRGKEVIELLEDVEPSAIEELVHRGFLEHVGEHKGLRQVESLDEESRARDTSREDEDEAQRVYRFCNALTQEVAARMLVEDVATALHDRLADHLLQRPELHDVSDHVRLAYHLQGAGRLEEAARVYYNAARDAFGQFGAAESLKLCEQVIASLPEGHDLAFDVLYLEEKALREVGRPMDHKRALDSLSELVEARSLEEKVEVWLRLIRYHYDQADFRAAMALIVRVREEIGSKGESEKSFEVALARADQLESYMRLDQGKKQEALRLIEQAIERLLAVPDRQEVIPELVNCYNIRGITLRRGGMHQEALATYEEAMRLASERVDGDLIGRRVLVNMGLANVYLGRFSKGLESYERALKQARRLGLRRDEAAILVNMGHAHMVLGDHDRAISTIQRGIYFARKVNATVILADGEVTLGVCYMQMHKRSLAERVLVEGLRLAESIPHVYLAVHAMLAIVRLTLEAEDISEQAASVALMQAEDCYERSEASNMQWGMLLSSVMMSRAYRTLNMEERAMEFAVQAWSIVQDGEHVGMEEAALIYGELCLERGDVELARDVVQQVIRVTEERAQQIEAREDRQRFMARQDYVKLLSLKDKMDS